MPRSGPRPHCWIIQGEIPHQQYLAFLQMRAQTNYRKEQFELTFEDFQQLWLGNWHRKGRSNTSYCLTRNDFTLPWNMANTVCVPRVDQLSRQKQYKQEKRNGKLKTGL